MTAVNKQLVNLIGAAASVAIILIGVFVFAIPMYSSATSVNDDADRAQRQNDTSQVVLTALQTQAADMTKLNADMAALRAQITTKPHIEDVIALATTSAAAHGGVVTAVAPTAAVAFSQRSAAVDASGNTVNTGSTPAATSAPSNTAASAADASQGPQQNSVTVSIDVPDATAATAILDGMRAGPRLIAILNADVTENSGKTSLKVALLTFSQP